MKTFDSNNKHYDGSNTDSEVERRLSIEPDDDETRSLWREYYNNFCDNSYIRRVGSSFSHLI